MIMFNGAKFCGIMVSLETFRNGIERKTPVRVDFETEGGHVFKFSEVWEVSKI